MTKRQRINLDPPVYANKVCEHCNEDYTPTSGRQRVCQKQECRAWKARNYPSRKNSRYVKSGERPLRKKCEWPDCQKVFEVAPTGLVPSYCASHRKEADNNYSKDKRQAWSRRTIDIRCRYQDCEQMQHPKGQGWCYKHYTILSVHGVSAAKWWSMFHDQNGLCPVCHCPIFNGTVVAVDHDHTTASGPRHGVEHVRGLVHAAPCNGLILGGIETAIANGWFQNALTYIGMTNLEWS